jgi:membrane-bound ClpP family serine protease
MWIITGVLLGFVCLATVVGFHSGPHAHAVAGAIGALGAGWLIYLMAAQGPGPVLWSLLGADLVVGVGVGAMAWKGLSSSNSVTESFHLHSLEGAEGVAVNEMTPEGIISIGGEHWSAVSVNGKVAVSGRVQVLRANGVRLEVWGEDAEAEPTDRLFELDENPSEEGPC